MTHRFFSERNLKFLLNEVFDCEQLTRYNYYQEHDREIFDMVLDAAHKLGNNVLRPHLTSMDREPPVYRNGRVAAHPSVREIMKGFGEGGWTGMTLPNDLGGQQLPIIIAAACWFIFPAANYSASVYGLIPQGANRLISKFGSREMIETYLPPFLRGDWGATMAMTEPEAGSSLSDIRTQAEPTGEGFYHLEGQKIFITNGDHDGAENIVHLMLARIKGAPAGVKGISLFVVPNKRFQDNVLESNDVSVTGVYHKMGYRGASLTQLSFGEKHDCRGWLIGEPNKGLQFMFHFMNEARMELGAAAAAIATAAYYTSLDYARTRIQGRKPGAKDPTKPGVPIIEHADIKRMLLFQRGVVEGALGLFLQCGLYLDLKKVCSGAEKEKYGLLVDLLTPVAKSFPSEMGFASCSQAMQILGGYGYCDEFPIEQFLRDARVHSIHEGASGIQAIDLLGRKVLMKGGKALSIWFEEVERTIENARKWSELEHFAETLKQATQKLKDTTEHLMGLSSKLGEEVFLADATLYQELFGIVAVAWQWLLQANVSQRALDQGNSALNSDFYKGKIMTCKYFFSYELPKTEGLIKRLNESDPITVDMKDEYFSD